MFKSKRRNLIIPQAEHARLSGIIANAWGNADFERPRFSFESFVKGVTFHDRGYGRIDNYPLGEMSEDVWLEIHERSAREEFDDKEAELVVQLQLKRLVAYNLTPERTKYVAERDAFISKLAKDNALNIDNFLWADNITHFCDNVSFDFCFEQQKSASVIVKQSNDDETGIAVNYIVDGKGSIEISPWPLNCKELNSFILGYSASGYPQKLEPVYIPVAVRRQAAAH